MDIIRHYIDQFNAQDDELFKNDIDNAHAYEWLKAEIPVLECPDKEIERTYYFRWWTYRKHVKSTPEGYVITEFLPKVPWSVAYNTINAAVGHHVYEGRWLKNGHRYLSDYIRFFLHQPTSAYKYSAWMLYAAWQLATVTGDYDFGDDFLEKACAYYTWWEETHGLENGMFWSVDLNDAMEYSISGTTPEKHPRRGIRPTLNSYMCADAWAIAQFARRAGRDDIAELYEQKYETIKKKINDNLWENGFYRAFHYDDGSDPVSALTEDRESSPRELIGYIPWMFAIPEAGRENGFDLLTDESAFASPFGLMTAERSHPRFLYEVNHECLWNGYVWPFATSQTLTALYTYIDRYPGGEKYNALYSSLLHQYAQSHTRTREDGTVIPWIDEVRHPLRDDWSSRTILQDWGWPANKGGYERGKDYNHSTFCDLVLAGLLGIHEENGTLAVTPRVPDTWDYFTLSRLPFHGKMYSIRYTKNSGVQISCEDETK